MDSSRPRTPLRIALVIYGSLDTVSGGYLYDRMLVRALERRGHHVELVSLPWRSYARHLADNLSPSWRSRLAAQNSDLVLQDELNHPSLAFVNSRPGPRRTGPPVVSIVHHLRVSERHPALLRPLYRRVERRYLATVDGFIFNSETTRASVEVLLPRRDLRSIVAFPAADHLRTRAAQSPAAPRRTQGQQLSVLFVGNLIERKGLHTLLDALARITNPASLEVAGSESADPAYARRVRAQAARLGLRDRVRFHGSVDDGALAYLYAKADALAVPSFEGFGIVYLEAMAWGCPAIATTAGAAHEIITHGVDGFLVPPGEPAALAACLDGLAADPALRARMSAAARARFERHPTWDQTTGRIVRWIEEFAQ